MTFRPLLLALVFTACAGEQEPDVRDVCDRAADHRADCVGDYATPPVCDEAAQESAEYLLTLSCEDIENLGADGKADGAFCDWFGAGCTPDEPIFTGASCSSSSSCGTGATCIEKRCFKTDGSELSSIMDRWTKTTTSSGSFTQLLDQNSETRNVRNQLMASARHSIHFTALLIGDDATGRETVAALAAAARRGVQVRVIIDATTQYGFSSYDVLQPLVDAGGEIIPFNPIVEWAAERWRNGLNANQRLHEKLLIVDGAHAVIGGRNVGDDYFLDGKWHDTCVYVRGPGVTDLQRMFLHDWDQFAGWEREAGCPQQSKYGFACPQTAIATDAQFTPSQSSAGTARTRPIYSDPRSQKTPLGYLATLNLTRTAQRTLYIANSYFVPPRRLRKHLKAAAARGVRVVVVTNSLGSTDAWWMYYASLNYYKELIGAGIEVYQYRGTETLHSKTMLIDGKLAVVGSYNLDPRSAASNSEALVTIENGAAVNELAADFQAMLSYSDRVSGEISAADWLKAKTFKLAEPLL
jgi:phosphatidylserine/phosphatidylglycerophosphate/cardiolipin synthase-like enzyme